MRSRSELEADPELIAVVRDRELLELV